MNIENDRRAIRFTAGKTCRDNTLCLSSNILIEKKSRNTQETHLMLIDLHIPINRLWKVLQETNINHILIDALKNIYEGSISQIKIGNKVSQTFPISKGLRQGCCGH